jgi:hypothetical protein
MSLGRARGCRRPPGATALGGRIREPLRRGTVAASSGRTMVVIGSTMGAIGTPTARSGTSSLSVSPPTRRPGTTWLDAPRGACPSPRSSGVSSATSLARSIASSSLALHSPQRLDKQQKHHQRMDRRPALRGNAESGRNADLPRGVTCATTLISGRSPCADSTRGIAPTLLRPFLRAHP